MATSCADAGRDVAACKRWAGEIVGAQSIADAAEARRADRKLSWDEYRARRKGDQVDRALFDATEPGIRTVTLLHSAGATQCTFPTRRGELAQDRKAMFLAVETKLQSRALTKQLPNVDESVRRNGESCCIL